MNRHTATSVRLLLAGLFLLAARTGVCANDTQDDFARRASWSPPSVEQVQATVEAWAETLNLDGQQKQQLGQIWQDADEVDPGEVLDRVVRSLAIGDDRVANLLTELDTQSTPTLPETSVLTEEALPDWARNNLRLYYGQWLADRQYFNEVRDQLEALKPDEVVNPAALLFYQSVAFHRLLQKDKCLPTLKLLLESEDTIPRRYATTARLMQSDIEPLKSDSLDEISRLMESIRVRLGHGRAGTRVRQEEDDVIAKLDKMIENLEKQAQQSSASSSGGQGSNQPSSPMEDSVPGGQTGPGNVDPKNLGSRTDWGNLPPKEREEALQQLGKDLPSHYRDVIEEYFQKLAKDGVQQP